MAIPVNESICTLVGRGHLGIVHFLNLNADIHTTLDAGLGADIVAIGKKVHILRVRILKELTGVGEELLLGLANGSVLMTQERGRQFAPPARNDDKLIRRDWLS